MFGDHRDTAQRAPQSQRSRIAHKHRCRGRIIPQKPHTTANQSGAENQDFACSRHIMNIKITGEIDPTHGVSDHAQRPCGDHNRHNRKPVQPIG